MLIRPRMYLLSEYHSNGATGLLMCTLFLAYTRYVVDPAFRLLENGVYKNNLTSLPR